MSTPYRINAAAIAAQIAAEDSFHSPERFGGMAGEVRSRDLTIASPSQGTPQSQKRIVAARTYTQPTSPLPAASRDASTTSALGGAHGAKRQMVDLRSDVIDALDVLETQREDTATRVAALKAACQLYNETALASVEAFDARFVHLERTGHDVAKLMAGAKLKLREPFFGQYGVPITTPTAEAMAVRLEQVTGRLLSDEEAAQLTYNLRRDVTQRLFPLGDGGIPEMLCAVNRFTRTDMVKTVVTRLEAMEPVDTLDDDVNRLEESLRSARLAEQLREAEVLVRQLLECSAKRVDSREMRLRLFASGNTSEELAKPAGASGGGAMNALDSILRNKALEELRARNDDLVQTAAADAKALDADHTRHLHANEVAIAQYDVASSDSLAQQRQVHAEQQAVWAEIQGLLGRLDVLGGQHEKIVRAHMKTTEEEQRRRQDHREYLDAYRRHRACLDQLTGNCRSGNQFLDRIADIVRESQVVLRESGVEERLRSMTAGEREAYVQAFGHYGTHANEQTARCDKRIVTAELMQRELDFLAGEAATVGDANRAAYARRARELEAQKRAATRDSTEVFSEYQHRESRFIDVILQVQALIQPAGHSPRVGGGTVAGVAGDEGQLLKRLRDVRIDGVAAHVGKLAAYNDASQGALASLRQRQSNIEDDIATHSEARAAKQALSPERRRSQAAGVESPVAPPPGQERSRDA